MGDPVPADSDHSLPVSKESAHLLHGLRTTNLLESPSLSADCWEYFGEGPHAAVRSATGRVGRAEHGGVETKGCARQNEEPAKRTESGQVHGLSEGRASVSARDP